MKTQASMYKTQGLWFRQNKGYWHWLTLYRVSKGDLFSIFASKKFPISKIYFQYKQIFSDIQICHFRYGKLFLDIRNSKFGCLKFILDIHKLQLFLDIRIYIWISKQELIFWYWFRIIPNLGYRKMNNFR